MKNVLSGVSQGSELGAILLNYYINDLFLATLYDCADDNALSHFSNTMPELVRGLENETNDVIARPEQNEMTVNLEKFHALSWSERIGKKLVDKA